MTEDSWHCIVGVDRHLGGAAPPLAALIGSSSKPQWTTGQKSVERSGKSVVNPDFLSWWLKVVWGT